MKRAEVFLKLEEVLVPQEEEGNKLKWFINRVVS
jgi:hypothetical protein